MTDTNVVVMRKLERRHFEQIASVDSRVKITDASEYASAEDDGDFSAREEFGSILAEAEVICGFWPPEDLLARAPKLKWFHTMLAGVDRPNFAEVVRGQVLVTNSTGIHGTQIGEWVFLLILMLTKNAPSFLKAQQDRIWKPAYPQMLEGKTLGILGLGNIGRAVARLGKAFGMRVIANRRSVKEITSTESVDVLLPARGLNQLLSESDYVVITLPATPETVGLIGEKELGLLKHSAYLINVARGKIIDEAALISALKDNRIAGAGLDTFASEPLSAESGLWDLPNVIITPHVSGRRSDYNDHAVPLFCENLRRYMHHENMINLVDKERAY